MLSELTTGMEASSIVRLEVGLAGAVIRVGLVNEGADGTDTELGEDTTSGTGTDTRVLSLGEVVTTLTVGCSVVVDSIAVGSMAMSSGAVASEGVGVGLPVEGVSHEYVGLESLEEGLEATG